jgi:hypothetical protein
LAAVSLGFVVCANAIFKLKASRVVKENNCIFMIFIFVAKIEIIPCVERVMPESQKNAHNKSCERFSNVW